MYKLSFTAVCLLGLFIACHAQVEFQRLYTTAISSNPPTCIVQASDGNFYGIFAHQAFMSGYGKVFKMTPAASVTTLGMITGMNDGLALAQDGNFYGTTTNGGLGHGTIVKITPAGQITSVYSFGLSNGLPVGLRAGLDGCLYGICKGSNDFRFTPQVLNVFRFDTNGSVTMLHSFTNSSGIENSISLPVQGPDGFLYGAFSAPQVAPPVMNAGRISFYQVATNGAYESLVTISNVTGNADDLVFGPDGLLYGTISGRGGYPSTDGSIFNLTTNGVFTRLFPFNGTNGSSPQGPLLPANDGSLYGTTFQGGAYDGGTLFRITTNGILTTLVNFNVSTGSNPLAPLIQASDGNIYGTTEGSQFSEIGTIFRLIPNPPMTSLCFPNGLPVVTWNSFTNGIYQVQYKSDLSTPAWTALGSIITASDSTISVSDNSPDPDHRLYRVVLLP